jgi:hypothetical protein
MHDVGQKSGFGRFFVGGAAVQDGSCYKAGKPLGACFWRHRLAESANRFNLRGSPFFAARPQRATRTVPFFMLH